MVFSLPLDYYDALGLTRSATETDVKKAYRKLALQYHPDKDDSKESKKIFNQISEAYDVLSVAERKALYDLYGETGLKQGVDDGNGEVIGGEYKFNPQTTPDTVFQRFFGTTNPYEALNDISTKFQLLTTLEHPKEGKPVHAEIVVDLIDVYNGCVKLFKHTRKDVDEEGEAKTQRRELVINVKPGIPDGTKFVFKGEGTGTPQITPGQLIVELKTNKHPKFTRDGNNLKYKAQIPVYEALAGHSVDIETLDNRTLTVPTTKIIYPGMQQIVKGEGMPIATGGKGDLIIDYDIHFPAYLSDQQKMIMKAAFFLPKKVSNKQQTAIYNFEKAFKDSVDGWSTGFLPSQ